MNSKEMEQIDYPIPMIQIGGMGPQYDDACFVLFLRFWKYFDEHPQEYGKLKEGEEFPDSVRADLDKISADINPTGAMFWSSLSHALYVKRHGYDEWIKKDKDRIVMWTPHTDNRW